MSVSSHTVIHRGVIYPPLYIWEGYVCRSYNSLYTRSCEWYTCTCYLPCWYYLDFESFRCKNFDLWFCNLQRLFSKCTEKIFWKYWNYRQRCNVHIFNQQSAFQWELVVFLCLWAYSVSLRRLNQLSDLNQKKKKKLPVK